MSTWADIETLVVQELAGVAEGPSPMIPTVAGHAAQDRKSMIAAILRERLPAAYVIVDGRGALERGTGRFGKPTLRVLLAAKSCRTERESRTGGVDVVGVFTLAQTATSCLQDLNVLPDTRLALVREEALAGEGGAALWEQTYEVRRVVVGSIPTFGGIELAGRSSDVRVELGDLRVATSQFSFPGIDGVFERRLGVRERTIWWRGSLWGGSHEELNGIESGIEEEVRDGQPKAMADSWGRQYEGCVLKAFRREGQRRCDELTGGYVQDCEIEFAQLEG